MHYFFDTHITFLPVSLEKPPVFMRYVNLWLLLFSVFGSCRLDQVFRRAVFTVHKLHKSRHLLIVKSSRHPAYCAERHIHDKAHVYRTVEHTRGAARIARKLQRLVQRTAKPFFQVFALTDIVVYAKPRLLFPFPARRSAPQQSFKALIRHMHDVRSIVRCKGLSLIRVFNHSLLSFAGE